MPYVYELTPSGGWHVRSGPRGHPVDVESAGDASSITHRHVRDRLDCRVVDGLTSCPQHEIVPDPAWLKPAAILIDCGLGLTLTG